MTICEEVVFSLCDYSKEFVREYKNPKLNQQDIDAIVVDYINYYAAVYYQMDLEMYTEDLRDGRRICRKIKKQDIFETLTFCKEKYLNFGILESVNRNARMNECNGKANFTNEEAKNVIDGFILFCIKA